MEEADILRELGLTEAEAQVYLALLEIGSSTAGPVIKKTGLHKATTYQIFQRLAEKGLVSSIIEGKKRHFLPANPRRLLDILHMQEEKLQASLPSLEAMLQAGMGKQEVSVYTGTKGIRSVLDGMLHEVGDGGEYFDFGSPGLFREVMGAYFPAWQQVKRKKRITSYVIFNETLKSNREFFKEYCGKARFYPKEYSSITDTFIYKDSVALIIWTAKPPVAVVIKNRDNAEGYRNQFKLMWKKAEKA
ncbi:MAG: helix-turn-helix domain-containing protein [Candidatus Micrarchaeia archaeon]